MKPNQPRPTKLYDYLFSGNGYKVRLTLNQLDIQVEHEEVDLLSGATRAPEFTRKNPVGQIPVLELDDGSLLKESNAIIYWLSEETPLLPTEPLLQAEVMQWMFYEQSNIDKVLGRCRFMKVQQERGQVFDL